MTRTTRTLGIFTLALATVVTLGASSAFAGSCSSSAATTAKANIVDTAADAGSFQTLIAAAQAAGLAGALSEDGPITVFAPTDEAFAKLPDGTVEMLLMPENKDKLVAVLTYHVAPGALWAEDVVATKNIDTLNGEDLTVWVQGETVKVGNATVTATDIEASNGVIHVIDEVILPSSIRAALGVDGDEWAMNR